MQEPSESPTTPTPRRRSPKPWRIILISGLIVVILLGGGVAYSQRHQIHQFLEGLTEPPVQPVHITPLALSPGTTTAIVPAHTADWTTYHGDNARTGFVANTSDPTSLANLWKHTLDGAVYAEPLVVGSEFIVVTENDSFYALNAQTGQIVWRTNVGRPVPLSALPCGNIDPLGITGTPVYDPQTGLVYAVAEIQGPAHVLFGIDLTDGQVKVRRALDPPGIDPRAYQQRPAVTLSGGRIYVASVGYMAIAATTAAW